MKRLNINYEQTISAQAIDKKKIPKLLPKGERLIKEIGATAPANKICRQSQNS